MFLIVVCSPDVFLVPLYWKYVPVFKNLIILFDLRSKCNVLLNFYVRFVTITVPEMSKFIASLFPIVIITSNVNVVHFLILNLHSTFAYCSTDNISSFVCSNGFRVFQFEKFLREKVGTDVSLRNYHFPVFQVEKSSRVNAPDLFAAPRQIFQFFGWKNSEAYPGVADTKATLSNFCANFVITYGVTVQRQRYKWNFIGAMNGIQSIKISTWSDLDAVRTGRAGNGLLEGDGQFALFGHSCENVRKTSEVELIAVLTFSRKEKRIELGKELD